MDVLKQLFEQHFQFPAEHIRSLQGELGGSGRAILRVSGGGATAIGILSSVREENVAFLEFSRHFHRHGLPVPEIYAEDLSQGAYLEQDLGDTTLFQFLTANRTADAIAPPAIDAYRKVVAALPRFQVQASHDLNYKVCYPRSSFDRQSISWDLNYFKYYFLRLAGIPFNEQDLERDFARLTKFLLSADRDYFLYRDFQSRNVMLQNGEPHFLDYQGGRKGALQYDIASLLYDGKADLPPDLRQQLLDYYLDCLGNYIKVDRAAFMEHYYAYVYVRILQALGAYGFRGFYERKPHFLQSVPYALKNLRWLAHNATLPIALPELMESFQGMLRSEQLRNLAAPAGLTVRIFSFSFHRQVPTDDSGNGGGFVFDARSLPNPGREERFKQLTGMDQAVIDYLASQQSVQQYLSSVLSLVDRSVASYQSRGFKSLMVSFGCTGGQHRSVYLAEQLANHLRAVNGVEVVVRHIEQDRVSEQNRNTEQDEVAAEVPSPMKAMILAAGFGTRLRPLTNHCPKALVTVAGRTLLEITLARLRTFGITDVIVNTHHRAEMIAEYLAANGNFGMRIEISNEHDLLDTGGGLMKAAPFFLEAEGNLDQPFLLHNVDVLSTIDLGRMLQFHAQHRALATLAVQERPTSRYLLFDESGELCGRRTGLGGQPELARTAAAPQAFAFSGIHVLSPRIFAKTTEQGAFSIVDCYLRLAAKGENILAFRADDSYWRDLGRPESIRQAELDIENNQLAEA